MPTKLKPIEEVIANPPRQPREKGRDVEREKIEPQPPPQPPRDKR